MLLLITGCIKVSSTTPYVSIKNEYERLEAYKETIRWAIEETKFDKIVFCENSNYDMDYQYYTNLATEYNKQFEYLTFQGDVSKTSEKGKGYGEGEIVLYALNNSYLLRSENAFAKITGRLKLKNIDKLVRSQKKNYFVNMRLLKQVDTRFYFIQKNTFINVLSKSHLNVDDRNSYFLEHAYFDSLTKNGVKYRAFYERPLFLGISGSTGKVYEDKKAKNEFIMTILHITNIFNNRKFWQIRERLKKRNGK